MTKSVLLRGTGLMLAVGVMAGCATAPTQEMSDARQAVQAARDAGAAQHTPVAMGKAEQDLTQAEHQLRQREYKSARNEAMAAKQDAVKARNMALAIAKAKKTVEKAEAMGALTQVTRDWLAKAEMASAGGDDEEVTRATKAAEREAQDDMRRYLEQQQRLAQENQALLEKVPALLEEARQAGDRLTDAQKEALSKGEGAYRQQQGREAYDLVNPVVEAVRALPPIRRILQYKVAKGDNLWRIASQKSVYGNPLWWPLIYLNNLDQIRDADVLNAGQLLNVDLDPDPALVNLAVEHARRREGTPEQKHKLDQQFLHQAK